MVCDLWEMYRIYDDILGFFSEVLCFTGGVRPRRNFIESSGLRAWDVEFRFLRLGSRASGFRNAIVL